jgi:hypothetical protein
MWKHWLRRKSGRQRHILDHPRTLNSGRIGVSLMLAERDLDVVMGAAGLGNESAIYWDQFEEEPPASVFGASAIPVPWVIAIMDLVGCATAGVSTYVGGNHSRNQILAQCAIWGIGESIAAAIGIRLIKK